MSGSFKLIPICFDDGTKNFHSEEKDPDSKHPSNRLCLVNLMEYSFVRNILPALCR